MADIAHILDQGKHLIVERDGIQLSYADLKKMTAPELNTLQPNAVKITLFGKPVKVWNYCGKVAYEWSGAESEENWREPALSLLEHLYAMHEYFGKTILIHESHKPESAIGLERHIPKNVAITYGGNQSAEALFDENGIPDIYVVGVTNSIYMDTCRISEKSNIAWVRENHPGVRIVALGYNDQEQMLLETGAHAFVSYLAFCNEELEPLVKAIMGQLGH